MKEDKETRDGILAKIVYWWLALHQTLPN